MGDGVREKIDPLTTYPSSQEELRNTECRINIFAIFNNSK
jgi:hypothetical protein